jgi:hypothetical protein
MFSEQGHALRIWYALKRSRNQIPIQHIGFEGAIQARGKKPEALKY